MGGAAVLCVAERLEGEGRQKTDRDAGLETEFQIIKIALPGVPGWFGLRSGLRL